MQKPVTFEAFVRQATGFEPYPFQTGISESGLPKLLRAPTGSGKTVAAVLPWLWRRTAHPDAAVRQATPRWLVLAQPFRTLVEQAESEVRVWLENVGLSDQVGLHVLMGGRGEQKDWSENPGRDAVVIGSIDMLLSRAMNRGYASNRFHWPIDFGVYNNNVQWVFDEVQLLGPALPTSRQLQAFRDSWGTVGPSASMWMSATVEPSWLETIDSGAVDNTVELTDADRHHPHLSQRLEATRTIRELPAESASVSKSLAAAVLEKHRSGTRSIVVVNTVARARDLYKALGKAKHEADIVLVHSRFRPLDRANATERTLAKELPPAGRIVVSTQALEAGVDISSTTLITEIAPWTSIVQRAGRCNRDGRAADAELWWYETVKAAPYDDADVGGVAETLRSLEGRPVTGTELADARSTPSERHPVLRRRDLLDLFDTTPTLSGEDIDIAPYIRDGDDRDVFLLWRELEAEKPDSSLQGTDDELCRVAIGAARKWVQKIGGRGLALWRFDPETGEWRSVSSRDIRPGQTLVADVEAGGYTAELGWEPKSTDPVDPVPTTPQSFGNVTDAPVGAEDLSRGRAWVRLTTHLADTERAAQALIDQLGASIPANLSIAAVHAAALHDIGKANPVFQELLRGSAADNEILPEEELWAKSSQARRTRYPPDRRHHRHELVSLLQLLSPAGEQVLDGEPALVCYLVAAHHGRVRTAIRPLEGDGSVDGRLMALGVVDGDETLPVQLPDGATFPAVQLNLEDRVLLGPSNWTTVVEPLIERTDLGPFRLAWLEAVVRLADWSASGKPSESLVLSQGGQT